MRYLWAFLVVLLFAMIAAPPASAQAGDDVSGWTFYAGFRGISNDSGLITKLDPGVAYTFNRHFRAYVGMPYYFVRESSTFATGADGGFLNGAGNAYIGGEFLWSNPLLDYTSNLVISAPTGDESRGFSTGGVTVDWSNNFSRTFSSVTPFATVGTANTVSDTSFFVRPFSSDGLIGHFEGGAMFPLISRMKVGGSAYAIRGSGEQRVVSRVIERGNSGSSNGRGNSKRVFETQIDVTGFGELANDSGFSAWLDFGPQSKMNFQIGYNRSARYDLDSVFFGMGFRVGR